MNAVLRNIILGLVLANVLLLAWKRWVVPSDSAWPERLGSANGAQLVLASSGKSEPDPAGAQMRAMPGNLDRARCARLGPFKDAGTADSIAQQLGGRGFSVSRTSAKGDIWVGYWVQLMDLKTEQDARKAVDRLVDAGLLDTYIVQTEPTYNVSLGVFRGRKGAERVRNLARGLGMDPQMMDRFSEGIQHWIKVRFQPDQTLNLQDLRLDTRQILRAEDVPCAADGAMDPSGEAG
ncbi:MAG: SPOR domain-containing protein [Gammaproteobacteria bacterium]|nr:SPOR domain-containing protein [Gammaproteobacteria bacterium]